MRASEGARFRALERGGVDLSAAMVQTVGGPALIGSAESGLKLTCIHRIRHIRLPERLVRHPLGPSQPSAGVTVSDNTETIITFLHEDGRTIEIDHLGICHPENRGEFAIYEGDKQIGEFMLPWAIEYPDIKKHRELPDDDELIAQAKLALADDPRVLTQGDVAQWFAEAIGISTSDPDAPPAPQA